MMRFLEDHFPFVTIAEEMGIMQLPRGRRIVRSTCVRLRTQPLDIMAPSNAIKEEEDLVTDHFEQSRKHELYDCILNGTFEVTPQSDVRQGNRIFGSRFIGALKQVGTFQRRK